jgi:hypothetical protein
MIIDIRMRRPATSFCNNLFMLKIRATSFCSPWYNKKQWMKPTIKTEKKNKTPLHA